MAHENLFEDGPRLTACIETKQKVGVRNYALDFVPGPTMLKGWLDRSDRRASFRKDVTLLAHGPIKYKRFVADVLLADETSVNQKLVKDGWCWWYRKYAPDDTVLEGLENEARETKRGVWVLPNPVPPWEYRKARRVSP